MFIKTVFRVVKTFQEKEGFYEYFSASGGSHGL